MVKCTCCRSSVDKTDTMNLELYKKSHEDLEKLQKKLFKFALNNLPREFILKELKKKKMIKYDWIDKSYVPEDKE